MLRIKITDIPRNIAVSANEMRSIRGGGTTLTYIESGGQMVVFPDVCQTPAGPGPIPIPYPNIGSTTGTATKVKASGTPITIKNGDYEPSTGDE